MSRKENVSIEGNPSHTFAIVIPAHNEEKTLSTTLHSCAGLNYPKDKYKIFVIADNCSDRTAEIARDNGAVCLERYNEEEKGKGFALEWGFKQILPEGHDALVVLDADCQLDGHACEPLTLFEKGESIQANDVVKS
jgi:glycosyltransferase involved in cell wall biosynthesis